MIEAMHAYARKEKMNRVLQLMLLTIVFTVYYTGSYLMAVQNY